MGVEAPTGHQTVPVDYVAIENTPQFQHLRSSQRRFVFPLLAACVVWYLVYVLLAGWATDFMSTRVFGYVNWGMILGLAQIVTTFIATTWYVVHANRKLDPLATELREQIEAKMEAKP
jgi:uncharacterized membrane protein (DUF485 family)